MISCMIHDKIADGMPLNENDEIGIIGVVQYFTFYNWNRPLE